MSSSRELKATAKDIEILNRLRNKIELAEPNENTKEAYLEKSKSNLIAAKILLENDMLEEAVSLAYYSMYHMITVLLCKTGIKCENHTASIILLKMIFHIDNSKILQAKKERIDKQYYIDFKITKAEVKETIKTAETFRNQLIDFIAKTNNEDIQKYRKELKESRQNLIEKQFSNYHEKTRQKKQQP